MERDQEKTLQRPGEPAGPQGLTTGHPQPAQAATQEPDYRDRRKCPRYEMSAKVTITIFTQLKLAGTAGAETERIKLVRQGFSVDLSPHGLCMVLDGKASGVALQQLIGQTVKIRLDLNRPGEPELNILGRIAWARENSSHTKIGIQFTEVPAADQHVLLAHCTDDEGELEQLSTLWELLVSRQEAP